MLAIARTLAGRHPLGSTGEADLEDEGEIGGVEGTISLSTNALAYERQHHKTRQSELDTHTGSGHASHRSKQTSSQHRS